MKTITLDETQLQCLKDILDYIYESEANHFEVHCADDGNKESHIYWKAIQVDKALESDF